jgi:hypothetical protein
MSFIIFKLIVTYVTINLKKLLRLNLSISLTKDLKQASFVELFKAHVNDIDLSEIRNAWQTGTPLGNDYFRQKVGK